MDTSPLWWKYKFGGPGTVKMPGAPCFVLGPLTDFRGPTLISVTYYMKWIRVRCRVMFSAWAPERTWIKRSGENSDILGPRNAFLGFWGRPRNGVPVRSGLLSPLLRLRDTSPSSSTLHLLHAHFAYGHRKNRYPAIHTAAVSTVICIASGLLS